MSQLSHQTDKQSQYEDPLDSVIKEFAYGGYSKGEIFTAVVAEYQSGRLVRQEQPHKSTIYRRISRWVRDDSDAWSFDTRLSGVDATTVLDTIAEATLQTDGRIHSISVAEAQLVSDIHAARPELNLWTALRISYEYLGRRREEEAIAPLDLLLAIAPWRNQAAFDRYLAVDPEIGGRDHPWLAWAIFGVIMVSHRLRGLGIDDEPVPPHREFALSLGHALTDWIDSLPSDQQREHRAFQADFKPLVEDGLATIVEPAPEGVTEHD